MSSNFIPSKPPPKVSLPILQRLIAAYKVWHEYVRNFSVTTRITLGGKIDVLFLEIIEFLCEAQYLAGREKLVNLHRATVKLDALKLFLQIAWELKCLDDKKFVTLSEQLFEMGRQLGGWTRQIESQIQKPNLKQVR